MEELDQSSSSSPPRHRRRGVSDPTDDRFECSVRSCAAATIADCVALCCCPCAVVNFVAFALVRVPWTVGRRCLAAGKRRLENKKKKKSKRKSEIPARSDDGKTGVVSSSRGWWTEEGIMDISSSSEGKDHDERVWSELCQLGHFGFGRVSFTGINTQIKPSPN